MRADRSLTCSRQVRSFLPAVLGTVLVCLLAVVSHAADPPRMKRADAFLGVHFDFHAGDDCDRVGARTTRKMVELVIDKVQPDYIQIDCKGHRGYSSYRTKVGNPAPGFVGDPLRVWRDVTRERGIALWEEIVATELDDGRRILAESGTAVGFVPWFARYAYETYVGPKRAVPSVAELQTILVLPCSDGPCIPAAFNNGVDSFTAGGGCWSSTTLAGDPSRAWDVQYGVGDVFTDDKLLFEFVRVVRGGR